MANNRMFLVHKPSMLGVLLGKRMAWGWYRAPEADHLQSFYDYLQDSGDQDNFEIFMEDCSESNCFSGWNYGGLDENGFMQFLLED